MYELMLVLLWKQALLLGFCVCEHQRSDNCLFYSTQTADKNVDVHIICNYI